MNGPDGLLAADLRLPPSAPGMRIGLLGGSFNPPHAAHRLISLTALKRLELDRVWWLVTPGNPLKSHDDLKPLPERIRLCAQIASHTRIEVTGFEQALRAPSTATTLALLRKRLPRLHFVWLMGADNLAGFHRWIHWPSIFASMPVAVADRPHSRYRALGSPAAHRYARARIPEIEAPLLPLLAAPAWCYLSGPLSELSSTAIRQRLRT